jgi:RNA polymerase sigma-70 factor (ECF subfamily)
MAQVSGGHVSQLALLFERHHRALFRYFVSLNRDRDLSEDLVQDVFFRILRYRASYKVEQPFTAWMYQIARNAGVDQARKNSKKVAGQTAQLVDIDDFADRRAELVSSTPGPEESMMRRQDRDLLYRALDLLPLEKRELLVLSRLQGMKYEDIAAVLECEVGAVKVRVFRAMRALEQIYQQLEQAPKKENGTIG